MGMFGTINFPLTSTTAVTGFADSIMKDYPRSSFATELKDTSKKSWSDKTMAIARDFAYTLTEGGTTTAAYV